MSSELYSRTNLYQFAQRVLQSKDNLEKRKSSRTEVCRIVLSPHKGLSSDELVVQHKPHGTLPIATFVLFLQHVCSVVFYLAALFRLQERFMICVQAVLFGSFWLVPKKFGHCSDACDTSPIYRYLFGTFVNNELTLT